MMRHLFIVARDRAALSAPLTIALDRHLARGEQIEIMPDRRSSDGARAPQWPTGRERRRSALAEQLKTLGYTICSRQEDHPVANGAAAFPREAPPRAPAPVAPPPPPPAPVEAPRPAFAGRRAEIEEMRAARAEAERSPEAAFRGARPSAPRLGERLPERLTDDEDWSPTGEDPYGEPPPRRGFMAGLASAFAIVVLVVATGAFLFAPQIREYLMAFSAPHRASVESGVEPTRTRPPSEDILARSATPGGRSATSAPPAATTPAPTTAPTAATPAPPVTAADVAPPRAAAPPAAPRETIPPRDATPQPTPPTARATLPSRDAGARHETASRETPPRETAQPRDVAALPPRDVPAARELPPPSLPPRPAELSSPGRTMSARTQRLPEFPGLPRVEVSRVPGQDGTTFTVRLTDQRGRPLPDAQVTLRQQSTDGYVRETMLEPISPAGSYRGAVPASPGRQSFTVRVLLGDRRVEMPVGE